MGKVHTHMYIFGGIANEWTQRARNLDTKTAAKQALLAARHFAFLLQLLFELGDGGARANAVDAKDLAIEHRDRDCRVYGVVEFAKSYR